MNSSRYSWEEELSEFFSRHETQLKIYYPGIKINRLHHLIQELNPFSDFTSENLHHLKKQLLEKIPLEYISGLAYFYKSSFAVDSRVLIPRSESEILVETVINYSQKNGSISTLLEVGVGSGALILSILSEVKKPIQAVATDISLAALEVAQKNYRLKSKQIHSGSRLDFFWADRLHGFSQKFDCIISNPPYIKMSDRKLVHEQVQAHEPHQALFLEDEIYDQWFNDFFDEAQNCLNPNGFFMMEGHEFHLHQLKSLISTKEFFEIELMNDYTGRPRFIKAKRKS